MERKPYLMSAVIGNSRLLASLGKRAELERLFWPRIDTPQNIGRNWLGLAIDGQPRTSWFHEDQWQSHQYYLPDSAVLVTVLQGSENSIKAEITDFAVPGRDLLVRHLQVTNTGAADQRLRLLLFSQLQIGEYGRYHTTIFRPQAEALWQFKQNYHFLWAADRPAQQFQCGGAMMNADNGQLSPVMHAMATDGAMAWDLGLLAPGHSNAITIFLSLGPSYELALAQLEKAREEGYAALLAATRSYWKGYLAQAKPVQTGDERLDALYRRSLIVFSLMTDAEHGSMIAAPEFDEDFTRCGGYAYCWGRDAAFITYAIDRAGYKEAAARFYRWAAKAQNADGSWEQRYYLDGAIAPNWGLQIDETGSVLWGMWQHYALYRERAFLAEMWPSFKKGAEFLINFRDAETGLPQPSFDLWEERCGEHTYSAVAVWAGLMAAADAATTLGYQEEAERWRQAAEELGQRIQEKLWHPGYNRFLRGVKLCVNREEYQWRTGQGEKGVILPGERGQMIYCLQEDAVVDVSLLGLTVPFAFLPPDDPRVEATAQAVEQFLTSPRVGGIKRYENDHYIGGNPWILCTLWLAQYHGARGNYQRAKELLYWAVDHQTATGLLPEQVDRETGQPAWVVPLTWSHAMLVLTVLDLLEKGQF
ncbi:oligosaccharide amylase [Carboxydocella sporoproducens DSM 16521]|uniref:Oligosaccharide amylase n=2 Tax=Carboxydocella TaxID=178898 RepID=A0A1T4R812_9FIRM|nr:MULTISPECIES: glycoside hydrolase family 15 protein [Carboxydocella]AVX19731.1 oligosaccharide amylase [Carboxydocella thermautotrophica]SKA12154.1 oligosaccharide amylase [Carboxydocella sporoproducens DSM 16521]